MMRQYKTLLAIAMPVMVENILQMFLGLNDSYLVAGLGLSVVSGVSIASSFLTIYQALFIALGTAISAKLSKQVVEKNTDKIGLLATNAVLLTLLVSVVLGLTSVCLGNVFLQLMGVEGAVLSQGRVFLSIVGGGIVSLGLLTSFGALARSTGQPRVPMFISLLTNVLDLLFSFTAIYIFHAGLIGIALSTVLARSVGAYLLFRRLHFSWGGVSWPVVQSFFSFALPAAGERLMMRAGDVVVVAIVVTLGTDRVAGQAIGEVLTQFNYIPGYSLATATVILVAQAHAKRETAEVEQLTRRSYCLSFIGMLLIAGIVCLFRENLLSFYTQAPQARWAAILVVVCSFLGTPITTGTLVYTSLWQGLGNTRLPFYITTLGMWGIRIPLSIFFVLLAQMGILGICLATLLDNLFRFLILYWRYAVKIKRNMV